MFTQNFRRHLDASGLTQRQFAKKAKVSQQMVSKWYTGASYPRMAQLQRMADVFGVEMTSLVNAEDDPLRDEIIQLINSLDTTQLQSVIAFIKRL